ncbi:MAG: ATPase domain-containing protein [Gemmatimonadales bacterium]
MAVQRDLVQTGIRGLDSILGGGISRGNIILVEGGIGTGKTTLGAEFVYRGASEFGEPGIIVLFEMSPDKLIRDAMGFGWDIRALEREGQIRIIFTTRETFRHELHQADSLLLADAAAMGARRIFVDGVAGVVSGAEEPRETFHFMVEGLHRENLTAMLAVEADAFTAKPDAPEKSIADTVIRLKMEDVQRAAVRSIEVIKSRGQPYQMGQHTFRIVDGRGIEVYRRVQAPRTERREHASAFDPTTRITTGVPGMDELMNGGYLVGSTTVVAGISGVGKSVMGLQFMAEGARLGQRSLMLSLDEQVPQILRNAASIGLDLQPDIDRGLLRLHYDPPQEIEVDHHFHHIELIVQEFRPTRVLFDSISTYGSSIGTDGRVFRDFFHALVALMKEYQTATVYNHENPEMLGMSSMMGDFALSSLVDNIVLMNWIELGDTFRHGLTVAKMRANPTTRRTHECEIVDGKGMRVLKRSLPPPSRAFSAYGSLLSRAPERSPDPLAPLPSKGRRRRS